MSGAPIGDPRRVQDVRKVLEKLRDTASFVNAPELGPMYNSGFRSGLKLAADWLAEALK